ncbi:MAG: hypothetical protein NTX45_04180 [Proteobacteria bacterium]|nr:hypothetical protein [Pseudomonadota bacterium]
MQRPFPAFGLSLCLSALLGQTPKVIWFRTANQSKAAVINLLIKSKDAIEKALQHEGKACIVVANF